MKRLAALLAFLFCLLFFSGCIGVESTRKHGHWHTKPIHIWDDWDDESEDDSYSSNGKAQRQSRAIHEAQHSAEEIHSAPR
jgi:hypothetical protein